MYYEVVAANPEILAVELSDGRLTLTAKSQTGVAAVTIRAMDEAGNVTTHTWQVTNFSEATVTQVDEVLTLIQDTIAQNPENLATVATQSPEPIEKLIHLVEATPELRPLLTQPDKIAELGVENGETIRAVLESSELAASMGLPASLGELFGDGDSTEFDSYFINGRDARQLMPAGATSPSVGILDFPGRHIRQVSKAVAAINPDADLDRLGIRDGDWATALVEWVDGLEGDDGAIVNLSFDLTQASDLGTTTRYELTPKEREAIAYARDRQVLLVVAAGNTGGKMSALGAASAEFDNIITVGSVDRFEEKTDYSSYGEGLDLVAPGGNWEDDPGAFVGTSRATAYVTAAASLVWAANPELSFRQVKQVLMETAADLNVPGWDAQTGAGLLDVGEAVTRSQFIAPEEIEPSNLPLESSLFSGEGRVLPTARPASATTEAAIESLETRQENLLEQWQHLLASGNPLLELEALRDTVKQQRDRQFDIYGNLQTQLAVATQEDGRSTEALDFATAQYTVELERWQILERQRQEIEAALDRLQTEKEVFWQESQAELEDIREDIEIATADLELAKTKLLNPFAEVDNQLTADANQLRSAATQELALAREFEEELRVRELERERHAALAESIDTQEWKIIRYERDRSGRTRPIWGWVTNQTRPVWGWVTNQDLLTQQQGHLWQAEISQRNVPILEQLSQQAQNQERSLQEYADFLEGRKDRLEISDGNFEDATRILEFLQQQASEQMEIAENYEQLAAAAAARQGANQDLADWHHDRIRQREQVGTRRQRKKRVPVYGWVEHPEHIPLRDRAQQLASEAEIEAQNYQQLALQARQQSDTLNEQVRKLGDSVRDWTVLKQGIDYEITAHELNIQGSQDLLALQAARQEDRIERFDFQLEQTQDSLEKLLDKLPQQEQLKKEIEQKLTQIQEEWEELQTQRNEARSQFQEFLDISGFLFPESEQLKAIQKQIKTLEFQKLAIQTTISELLEFTRQYPSDLLQAQLELWQADLEAVDRDLAWANLQNDRLALGVADSPERLEIAATIAALETQLETPNLPAREYLNFLEQLEGSGDRFLGGFDNLTNRLFAATAEANWVTDNLASLHEQYLQLELPDGENPELEERLAELSREIELTEGYLKIVSDEVDRLQRRANLADRIQNLTGEYQQDWTQWQEAAQTQTEAIETVLETRERLAPDLERRGEFAAELEELQQDRETAATLEESIAAARETLAFTQLQQGNRELQLQSLLDRDLPLENLEAHYLAQAETHAEKIWQWQEGSYVYNEAEAAAYRTNLELASFQADLRNQLWQQRRDTEEAIARLSEEVATQEAEIADREVELGAIDLSRIDAEIARLQAEIQGLDERLQPLETQEADRLQAFQTAVARTQALTPQLTTATTEQAQALEQLIGFGLLASTSDADFFGTQVEPPVRAAIAQFWERLETIAGQIQQTQAQIAAGEAQLADTPDEANQQALQELITQAQTQLADLETLQTQTQTAADDLETRLVDAIAALTPLRQEQELEIRQQLEAHQTGLAALQSQLASETAAEAAITQETVLAYAQLADGARQDLLDTTTATAQHLAENAHTTLDLGQSGQQLSQATDTLLDDITEILAQPRGQVDRATSDLRDGIASLGVLAGRADALDATLAETEAAIDRIQFQLTQDAALWETIAPIATRYGLESEALQTYEAELQEIQDTKAATIAQNAQPLRDRAELLDAEALVAYNLSYKQGPTRSWNERRWVRGRKGGGHWTTVRRSAPDPEYIRYETLTQEAADLRQQAEALELEAEKVAQNATKALPATFLAAHPDNGGTIELLQAQTLNGRHPDDLAAELLAATDPQILLDTEAIEGRNPLQGLFEKAQAAQAELEAQGHATLAQADWYEEQAAQHWELSRKAGPTWRERRRVKGKSGKSRTETITHVDHHWVLWNNYTQLVPQLRAEGGTQLAQADKWRKAKERFEPLANQWADANDGANRAAIPILEARNIVEQLQADRESLPQQELQLASLQELLPTVEAQLAIAQAEADAANAEVRARWQEYETESETYTETIADILQRRGNLDGQALEMQQQLAESEKWVERESIALAAELDGTLALQTQLENQRGVLEDTALAQKAQLDRALEFVTHKAALLTQQQTALTQKRTLLTAQNEVILAERQLVDAYIQDPDADTDNLQQQLQGARDALAEAQRLAEQAEAASIALTQPLQELNVELLAQNDAHLAAAREQEEILGDLVEAVQLEANYTAEVVRQQQILNDLELPILQRLQEATAAGYEEAKHLLDVAEYNDFATAAAIYYRDYRDLAGDRGGCAGGAGRAQDRVLADRYYREMLKYRELQRRAQTQADAFGEAKAAAEEQLETLQAQQTEAAQLLAEANEKLGATQTEREANEQALALAQARLDGITRIREQTERTLLQLVALEELNLAQAQLERDIAQQRQAEIEEAVKARQERDRLELERQRQTTTAQIEQLRQQQAELELQDSLYRARGSLGFATPKAVQDAGAIATQLAGLQATLEGLPTENPELPPKVLGLLATAQGDIDEALQGKEAETIQENLLAAMAGLIGQVEQYQTEIDRLELAEQWDNQLLATAGEDLRRASGELLRELERSETFLGERNVIEPLYLEVLNKVVRAEQALDVSEDLAAQSKSILDKIIGQRVEQRKARKKSFWSKILGVVSGVISILGTLLSFTPLAPLGIALNAASAGINAIQSVMNGDWLGGLFSAVMAGVNAFTGGAGNALGITLTQGQQLALQGLTNLASSAFSGVRSIQSGDSILGFLQILGGVAGSVASGLSGAIGSATTALKTTAIKILEGLQTIPLQIYGSIKAIEKGDWLGAVSNIFKTVMSLGKSLSSGLNQTAQNILKYIDKGGSTALAIGKAIKEGGIESWLSGIDNVLNLWGDDIKGWVDKISGDPIDPLLFGNTDELVSSCQG